MRGENDLTRCGAPAFQPFHRQSEKPLAPSVADGQAMADRAAKSDRVAAVGFTFRRSPAINAIREQVTGGTLGPVTHFNGHYWCDYGFDRDAPMSWRYRGGPGSGALADIGAHVVDVGEFLCGPVETVRGAVLTTMIPDRPVPLGIMDFPSAGHGQSDFFTYQARAFLDEIAGRDELPRCPGLGEGLHNLRVLDAVVASAHADGRSVTVEEGTS